MQDITGNYHVLNGELKPNIYFDNSFLQKPKYLYEVFRAISGTPLFIEDHLDRFEHSLRLSKYAMPYNKADIICQINMLIRENNLKNGNIKMVYLPDEVVPGFLFRIYITPHEYPTEEQYKLGVAVSLFKGTREQPNVKLMDCLLRKETDKNKIKHKVYEMLLVDDDGYITEGSRSNIFFIKDNSVITSPVDCVLPGVTRKNVIDLCHDIGIIVKEQKVHKDSVKKMKSIFLTGTSRKVLPVNRIDKQSFQVIHPLMMEIKDGFNKRIEEYIINHT